SCFKRSLSCFNRSLSCFRCSFSFCSRSICRWARSSSGLGINSTTSGCSLRSGRLLRSDAFTYSTVEERSAFVERNLQEAEFTRLSGWETNTRSVSSPATKRMTQLAVFISASFMVTPLGSCGNSLLSQFRKNRLGPSDGPGLLRLLRRCLPNLYVQADLVKPVLAAPSVQGIKLFMTAPLQCRRALKTVLFEHRPDIRKWIS